MPPLSRKKGQLFVSRAQELEAELNQLKKDLDVGDYAVPIDNLLEPGMAEGALKTLDAFVVERSGTKLGFLYEDLIEDCVSDLDAQYDQVKAKMQKGEDWTPLPIPTSEPMERLVEQRKAKEKTRPSHSSAYEIAPAVAATIPATEPATPAQTFKVSASTAAVFQALFNKLESRRPVSWAAFEGAMADLGFSVLPKYGSFYTVFPPDSMTIKKPLTMHRPHRSQIEGYSSLIYAQRLQRTYGWGGGDFRGGLGSSTIDWLGYDAISRLDMYPLSKR
ncbi:hypothetical protein CPLU01_12722 [Colletotrichum plurivorum]|uniref:Uncharacterized protein n=1 Tax=Colletotrichum plurivorum TaxID=2175906 RepID=A0A8H6JX75_9PEZI|nr:hypothetical protein CPLU01_12722 [Colletotrichum plurivorum]